MNTNSIFHSGFITIVGRPNVGKSSIMNKMIGEKIAIVSSKPQTTRNRIMGVITHNDNQLVFLDTPGIHDPRTKLGEYMMHSVQDAMDGMDCVLVVVDASHITEKDLSIASEMAQKNVPSVLAINKIDLVSQSKILECTSLFADKGFADIIPVSSYSGDGMDDLLQNLIRHMPEGPKYFPDDMMTDQPERLLCAEIIREKALRNLRDEIPHGIGIEMIKIEEINDHLTEMHANIYCERDAHKAIIIGKNGAMLKKIGSEARSDIERLLNIHVNLQLWVKVRPDWRNRISDLKDLGYE